MDRWRWKQECEGKKKTQEGDVEEGERSSKRVHVLACAHSCDSVTTARLLDLRDCRCQSLSPLFYCETMQVFPGVCACVRVCVLYIPVAFQFTLVLTSPPCLPRSPPPNSDLIALASGVTLRSLHMLHLNHVMQPDTCLWLWIEQFVPKTQGCLSHAATKAYPDYDTAICEEHIWWGREAGMGGWLRSSAVWMQMLFDKVSHNVFMTSMGRVTEDTPTHTLLSPASSQKWRNTTYMNLYLLCKESLFRILTLTQRLLSNIWASKICVCLSQQKARSIFWTALKLLKWRHGNAG